MVIFLIGSGGDKCSRLPYEGQKEQCTAKASMFLLIKYCSFL
jgi:hypothetical protein